METYNRSLGPPRVGGSAGVAGAARLRRSPPVPPRPPDAGAADGARLRSDRQRERCHCQRRDALRRQRPHRRARSRTTWPPTCWCCSPTRPACTRPIRASIHQLTLISDVLADDPLLSLRPPTPGSDRGSGGMASKLSAARMASWSGVRAVIAAADRPDVLVDAVAGVNVGTTFLPSEPQPAGAQAVDRLCQPGRWDCHRRRRCPAGVGRARHIVAARRGHLRARASSTKATSSRCSTARSAGGTGHGVEFGTACCATIKGQRTGDLPSHVAHEVIHRDDLVLLV